MFCRPASGACDTTQIKNSHVSQGTKIVHDQRLRSSDSPTYPSDTLACWKWSTMCLFKYFAMCICKLLHLLQLELLQRNLLEFRNLNQTAGIQTIMNLWVEATMYRLIFCSSDYKLGLWYNANQELIKIHPATKIVKDKSLSSSHCHTYPPRLCPSHTSYACCKYSTNFLFGHSVLVLPILVTMAKEAWVQQY